jgi:hypothetical protein
MGVLMRLWICRWGYHMNNCSPELLRNVLYAHYDLKTDRKIQQMLQYGQVKTSVKIQRSKTNHVISAVGQRDQK